MVAVIDADPSSAKYGEMINVLTVDSAGGMPHHAELELPSKGPLFTNDYATGHSYMIDFSDPTHPRLTGALPSVPRARQMHSVRASRKRSRACYDSVRRQERRGDPGGLAEFDGAGKLIRFTSSADSAFSGAKIRTYALTTLPAIDRVVTTSSPMDTERTANVVQVWRLSDLQLLKTVAVPQGATDSAGVYPFVEDARGWKERAHAHLLLRFLSHQRPRWRCEDRACAQDGASEEHRLQRADDLGEVHGRPDRICAPVCDARHSDPAHPVEVASFATDSTYYPHWIASDPGSDRIIMTDQGDGPPMIMMGHFDKVTGRMWWDDRFRDEGAMKPGVSLSNVRWPNGVTGMVMPHAALFVP